MLKQIYEDEAVYFKCFYDCLNVFGMNRILLETLLEVAGLGFLIETKQWKSKENVSCDRRLTARMVVEEMGINRESVRPESVHGVFLVPSPW